MKIEKVNVRVVKEGPSVEMFVTCDNPHMNFVIHSDEPAESGQYSLELTPVAEHGDIVG